MAMVVKVQCDDGEIYRLMLQEEPSFDSIVRLVANCRPDLEELLLSKGGCALKYADDEGDLCTLAPSTFADFLDLQKRMNSRIFKLQLKLPQTTSNEDGPVGARQSMDRSNVATETDADAKPSVDTPPQGPPPGLEREDTNDSASGCGPGAWGPGGNGGGPRRLLGTLRMLREAGMLTPAMFASLTVQWLPLVTQRVARKVDKINHVAREGLDQSMQKMLEIIQEQAAATPGLEQHSALIAEALSGDKAKRRLGEAILEMLKALRGLGFEVQTRFCESVASSLLPYLENLTSKWCGDKCGSSACGSSWQHHPGSTCSGCGAAPIEGPRFRCPVCPSYDLCGNCYPQKNQLHGNCPGCRKDFVCTISPGKDVKRRGRGFDKEKAECHYDWQAWAGKGAGGPSWMEALAAPPLGTGMLGFNPLFPQCAWPFTGMENASFEGQDLNCWPMFPWKGKGKGKKGKNKQGKGQSHTESKTDLAAKADDTELEEKVASLLELQLANEEVIRDLLLAHDGDMTQVQRLLTS